MQPFKHFPPAASPPGATRLFNLLGFVYVTHLHFHHGRPMCEQANPGGHIVGDAREFLRAAHPCPRCLRAMGITDPKDPRLIL